MSANGNLPAYPVDCQGQREHTAGLTKREAFAVAAMQGWLASYAGLNTAIESDFIAAQAVQFADALLAELAKEPK